MGHDSMVWLGTKLVPGLHEHLITRTRVLDEFVKEGKQGSGAHGVVWQVVHPSMGRMALKETKEVSIMEMERAEGIARELDVLKRAVECPQIVDFYGAFYKDARFYFFMEPVVDCAVEPLHRRSRSHPLTH